MEFSYIKNYAAHTTDGDIVTIPDQVAMDQKEWDEKEFLTKSGRKAVLKGDLYGLYTTGTSDPVVELLDDSPAAMGRKGGKAKTAAKTAASRANGARGGRPPKIEEFYWDSWDQGRVVVKIGRSPRGELWVNWGCKWERLTQENLPDPPPKENFGIWQEIARDIDIEK